MKAVVAGLFVCGMVATNVAQAQYPIYQAPVVVYSVPVATTPVYSPPVVTAPIYSSYSLPMRTTYAVPLQGYSPPAYSVYSAPAYPTTTYTAARPGLVNRVIDFERRKNAWLRQTFLGRP